MNFTRAQIKGLWFVIGIFAAAVLYQYAEPWLSPQKRYDFSAFEKKFLQRKDSLLQTAAPGAQRAENITISRQSTPTETSDLPININTAPSDNLQELPRIGPAIAARIIEFRTLHGPFKRKTDLKNVKGIGEKTFRQLEPLISIE
ncbi:MAG: helix-hairpin-helix domain-containing protein [Calditrichia bacterium]